MTDQRYPTTDNRHAADPTPNPDRRAQLVRDQGGNAAPFGTLRHEPLTASPAVSGAAIVCSADGLPWPCPSAGQEAADATAQLATETADATNADALAQAQRTASDPNATEADHLAVARAEGYAAGVADQKAGTVRTPADVAYPAADYPHGQGIASPVERVTVDPAVTATAYPSPEPAPGVRTADTTPDMAARPGWVDPA